MYLLFLLIEQFSENIEPMRNKPLFLPEYLVKKCIRDGENTYKKKNLVSNKRFTKKTWVLGLGLGLGLDSNPNPKKQNIKPKPKPKNPQFFGF